MHRVNAMPLCGTLWPGSTTGGARRPYGTMRRRLESSKTMMRVIVFEVQTTASHLLRGNALGCRPAASRGDCDAIPFAMCGLWGAEAESPIRT